MNKASPAFTLIELLVVFSILAILGAVAFAGYNNYSRAQLLKNAAKELRTNLQFAQNKAITQEKPTTPGCTKLDSYKLVFPNERSYRIEMLCDGNNTGPIIRQFNLPGGITKTGTNNEVVFKAGSGVSTSNQNIVFTLRSEFGGSNEVVTITPTGVIQ